MLTTRTVDEQDARLYPSLNRGKTIALEPLDGAPLLLHATGLVVSERASDKLDVHLRSRVRVELLISDARVAVSCNVLSNEGWPASVRSTLTRIADRYGIRSAEPAGRLLVGQVRYSWLRCVGFKPRHPRHSDGEVRLGVVAMATDGASRELFLDVALPRAVNPAEIAQTVAARAARYLLTYYEPSDEAQRHDSQQLADEEMPLGTPPRGKFALYHLPGTPFVSAASAYPAATVRAEVQGA